MASKGNRFILIRNDDSQGRRMEDGGDWEECDQEVVEGEVVEGDGKLGKEVGQVGKEISVCFKCASDDNLIFVNIINMPDLLISEITEGMVSRNKMGSCKARHFVQNFDAILMVVVIFCSGCHISHFSPEV